MLGWRRLRCMLEGRRLRCTPCHADCPVDHDAASGNGGGRAACSWEEWRLLFKA